MALSDSERKALAMIQQSFEQDDPKLALQFRKLGTRKACSSLAHGAFVLATICLGLGLLAIGVDLALPACSAAGLVTATCGPIATSIWLARHPANRRH